MPSLVNTLKRKNGSAIILLLVPQHRNSRVAREVAKYFRGHRTALSDFSERIALVVAYLIGDEAVLIDYILIFTGDGAVEITAVLTSDEGAARLVKYLGRKLGIYPVPNVRRVGENCVYTLAVRQT